jgi:hypothetical protein
VKLFLGDYRVVEKLPLKPHQIDARLGFTLEMLNNKENTTKHIYSDQKFFKPSERKIFYICKAKIKEISIRLQHITISRDASKCYDISKELPKQYQL